MSSSSPPSLPSSPSPSPPASSSSGAASSSSSSPSTSNLPPPPPPPHLESYPPIVPGGSLLLAWQLQGRRVLIVGGGEVASSRLRHVLNASAGQVIIIAPRESLHPEVRFRIFDDPYARERITYKDRVFNLPSTSMGESLASSATSSSTNPDSPTNEDDLANIDMVLTAIDSPTTSQFIYSLAHARNIPCNCADIPPSCDFFFGSQIRSGALQIMVSTNGKSPKVAAQIRGALEGRLEELAPRELGGVERVIENVGALRERLRTRTEGVVGGEVGRRRMRWMIDVCESYSFAQLAILDDVMMEKLLDMGWEHREKGKNGKEKQQPFVPSFVAIAGPVMALRASARERETKGTILGLRPESIVGIVGGIGLGVAGTLGVIRWLGRT